MTGHFISPNFQASKASPGSFNDWVDIWEDRISGWILDHAEKLRQQGANSAIAALHLAVAFIEPYEVMRTGKNSGRASRRFFTRGLKRILGQTNLSASDLDKVAHALYSEVRCGLYHSGTPTGLVYLTNAQPALLQAQVDVTTGRVSQVLLNPDIFVQAVRAEFQGYVARLRNPADPQAADLRKRFERAWHLVHQRPSLKPRVHWWRRLLFWRN